MKTKIFSLFALSILTLVLFMGLASAAIALTVSSAPATLTSDSNSTTFNVSASGDIPVNFTAPTSPLTIEDINGELITVTITSTSPLENVNWASFIVVATSISDDLSIGTHSNATTIYAENVSDANVNSTTTITLTFDNTKVCEYNDNGHLGISIEDVSVRGGFGKDEEWLPLDEIEVELEVSNTGTDDIKDIVVEWGLYNVDKGEWVIDDEESDFKLKKKDEKTVLITFKLDDVDEFEDDDDYVFYAWATGEDEVYDGNETCESASSTVEIVLESDFVVLDEIQYPETAQCGAEVQISADVWNIGDDDQEEVSVWVYNTDLGLNEYVEMGDIDAFEDSDLPFTFKFDVPLDVEEKTHTVKLTVYDEDDEAYEGDFDDENAIFNVPIVVAGGCAGSSADQVATISPSLESDAKAGEDLIIKVTVTNTGSDAVTYTLNAAGYTTWASSAELDPETLSLAAGASGDVMVTFAVDEDVEEGEYTFDVEIISENEMVLKQPVAVTIEGSGFGLTGASIRDNPYIWGIGFINLVLVIVIILVAVRLARK